MEAGASTTNEVIEAIRVRYAEVESKIGLIIAENKEI